MERQFGKALLEHGWEKVPNWECFFVNREKGPFLSVYVDDIKLAGKKQNIDPMWKELMKEVDVGEPTSFLDHVFWVALNEIAKRAKILCKITETCFILRSVQERKIYHLVQGNLTQISLHGPVIWKVMQRNVWSDIANRRTKQPSNCTKSQRFALTVINLKKRNWDVLENCQKFALKLS